VGESASQCRGYFSSGAKQDDSKQGLASSDPYSLLQYTVAGENTKIIANVLLIVHCVLALIIGYKNAVDSLVNTVSPTLKGQCHKIFCFWLFHESVSPRPRVFH
jgi:hypothetical protein